MHSRAEEGANEGEKRREARESMPRGQTRRRCVAGGVDRGLADSRSDLSGIRSACACPVSSCGSNAVACAAPRAERTRVFDAASKSTRVSRDETC